MRASVGMVVDWCGVGPWGVGKLGCTVMVSVGTLLKSGVETNAHEVKEREGAGIEECVRGVMMGWGGGWHESVRKLSFVKGGMPRQNDFVHFEV
ncbi:hypothetical protein Tco_0374117 [Tanacetum coccineum]